MRSFIKRDGGRAWARLAGPVLAAIFLWGCATKPVQPAPLPLGAVAASVTHYAGTVLSGPGGAGAKTVDAISAASAGHISVTWLAMEKMPPGFAPAGPQAAIVTAARGNSAVMSSVSLSRDMRFGPAADAHAFVASVQAGKYGRFALFDSAQGIVWPGVTAQFDLSEAGTLIDPLTGLPARRGLGLRIEPNASAADKPAWAIGLSITDFVPGVALQTETLILNESAAMPTAYVFLEPFRFGTADAVIAAVVQISPPPASDASAAWQDHQKLCAAVSTQLAGGANYAAPQEIAGWPGLDAAQSALAQKSGQRSALVFTAGEAGVPIAVDVALVADDSVVSAICGSIVKDLSAAKVSPDSPALAWLIEKRTYGALLDLLNNEKVPPELSGLLSAYAGQAGRQAASLGQVLREATGPADLDARLVKENMDYLEDSSPTARVRAYDWLNSRGLAPGGYDPLAAAQQRRAALEAMRRGGSTRPTSQKVSP